VGATSSQSGESISFTLFVPNFEIQYGIGGGVCLGNRRVTDPRPYAGVRWSPDGRRFVFWRITGRLPSGMGLADVFVAKAGPAAVTTSSSATQGRTGVAGAGNEVIGAQDNRVDLVDGGRDAARVDRRRDRIRSIERRLP
jgi:hypothetical protein